MVENEKADNLLFMPSQPQQTQIVGEKKEITKTPVKESTSEELIKFTDEDIRKYLFDGETDMEKKLCTLIYGVDGTGKSGIVLNYIAKNLKDEEKSVIIDLDSGCLPLIASYYPEKAKQMIVRNPISMTFLENEVVLDYKLTLSRIKAIVDFVKRYHKKEKIKALTIDGISTLLKYAERQMRLEKHIAPDGGVVNRFWMVRNQMFEEILEEAKSIGINVFFISQEDFIPIPQGVVDDSGNPQKLSSIKSKANAMAHQKIRCFRKDDIDKVEYIAIIDKSKYNSLCDGKSIVFCTVDKKAKTVTFDTSEIFKELI